MGPRTSFLQFHLLLHFTGFHWTLNPCLQVLPDGIDLDDYRCVWGEKCECYDWQLDPSGTKLAPMQQYFCTDSDCKRQRGRHFFHWPCTVRQAFDGRPPEAAEGGRDVCYMNWKPTGGAGAAAQPSAGATTGVVKGGADGAAGAQTASATGVAAGGRDKAGAKATAEAASEAAAAAANAAVVAAPAAAAAAGAEKPGRKRGRNANPTAANAGANRGVAAKTATCVGASVARSQPITAGATGEGTTDSDPGMLPHIAHTTGI